jgi:methyl-accepting chemotaxis protein
MAKHKRRQYLVDKKLQTKYALLTILLLVIYTFLFAVILFTPSILGLSTGETLAEQTEAARTLLNLHASVWPALGIVIVILAGISVFITHKIAGPVYRFKKVLTEVADGNLDISIKLRKRDDLQDLAEDMNGVIVELRNFVQTLQEDHETMSSCIDDLEERIKSNQISSESANELIEKLRTSRQKTAETLKKYTG